MFHSSTIDIPTAKQERNNNRSGAFRPNDVSTERALHAIVRRVLRTQTHRTRLERMVLKEARRFTNGDAATQSRDSIVELIVKKLRKQLPGRMIRKPSANVASAAFSGLPTITIGYSTQKAYRSGES